MAKIVVGDIVKVKETGKFGKVKSITEETSLAIIRIGQGTAIFHLDNLEFVRKGEGAMKDATTAKEFKPVTHMTAEEAQKLLDLEEEKTKEGKKVEETTPEPASEKPKKPKTQRKTGSEKKTGKTAPKDKASPKPAPKTPKKPVVDNTSKPTKKKSTGAKKGSIGEYALKLLGDKELAGNTYEELAEMVRAKFDSKTSSACLGWYYSKFKLFLGLVPRAKKAKITPKTDHPLDESKPKPKPKAKIKPTPKPKVTK